VQRTLQFAYSIVVYVMFLGVFLYAVGFANNLLVPKSIDSGAAGDLLSAVLINSLLLGLFALQHSIMARPWFKREWTKIVPEPIERSTFVLFTNLCLILLFWKWQPMPQVIWDVQQPIFAGIIWAAFAAGWVIVLISTFLIDHFALFGLRQTYYPFINKEAPPIHFMKKGLYKYCRHPIMLGFIVAFLATPQMTVGHLFFFVMTTGYILIALIFEENDLTMIHGDDYRKYQKSVPKLCPVSFLKGN